MNQLTLRGFDADLERALRDLARERGCSLNRAALELMRRGAGQPDAVYGGEGRVGDSLDSFIGLWTEEDEQELMRAIEPFEQIDPELWS